MAYTSHFKRFAIEISFTQGTPAALSHIVIPLHPASHRQLGNIRRLNCISTEAEFLNVIGTKVLRVFLLAINSHLYN
jgi:hypothetical protein